MRNPLSVAVLIGLAGCITPIERAIPEQPPELAPAVTRVSAGETALSFHTKGLREGCSIIELSVFQRYQSLADLPDVWNGTVKGQVIEVPRFQGKRDRMFSKFLLVETESGEALDTERYVNDLSLDCGERGRQAARLLFREAHRHGIVEPLLE